MTKPADPLSRAVARVEPLTLILGAAAAVYEFAIAGWQSALAIAIGSVISWLNYRWLRAGVLALTPAPAPAPAPAAPTVAGDGAPMKSAPPSAKGILKFLARLALLLAALYVILSRSLLPASPLLAGLFAAVAAVILQMVYLLATGGVAKRQ